MHAHGTVVFLDVGLPVLRERVHDYEQRGIARRADQNFEDLYEERGVLYRKYADARVVCGRKPHGQVCDAVIPALNSRSAQSLLL